MVGFLKGVRLLRKSDSTVSYLGRNCDISPHVDVTLCLKDGQIKTHRAVLAAGCHTLKVCLQECYPHLTEEDGSATVLLPDFAVSEAFQLLQALYGKTKELVIAGHVAELANTVGLRWTSEIELKHEELKDLCLKSELVVKIEVNEEAEMLATQIGNCGAKVENTEVNGDSRYSDMEEEMEEDNLGSDPDYTCIMDPDDANTDDYQFNGMEEEFRYSDDEEERTLEEDRGVNIRNEANISANGVTPETYYEPLLAAEQVKPLPHRIKQKSSRGATQSRCMFCLEFFDEDNYFDHILESHSRPELELDITGKPKCTDCDFVSATAEQVEVHIQFEHGKLYCIYCHKFLPIAYHRVHMRYKHTVGPRYRCFFCPRLHDFNKQLDRHMEDSHAEDFIAMNKEIRRPNAKLCQRCGFHYEDRFTFANHMITKHSVIICPMCQIPFERVIDMQRHATWIHQDKDFTSCLPCKLFFRTAEDKRQHLNETHRRNKTVRKRAINRCHRKTGPRLYGKDGTLLPRCVICSEDFVANEDFYDHLQMAHRPKFSINCSMPDWLICPELDCRYSIPDGEALENHIFLVHEKRYCIYCKKYFPQLKIKKHYNYTHNVHPGVNCLYCPRLMMTIAELKDHNAKVHPKAEARLQEDPNMPGNILCHISGCVFTTSERLDLMSHLVKDHKIYCCPICLKKCSNKKLLIEHGRLIHIGYEYCFCQKCNRIFQNDEDRHAHMEVDHPKVVEQKQAHLCDMCGKSLASEGSLRFHKKKNCKAYVSKKNYLGAELPPKHPKLYSIQQNDDKMFVCPEENCGITHRLPSLVEKHFNLVHNRQTCQYCGKIYSYFMIMEHIAFQHTGKTNRLQCPDCPKMFYNKTHLRNHKEAVHMTNTNFPCSVCGEEFPTRRLEVNHRSQKHTRKRNNPCPICHRNFRSSTLLQPHCDKEHPGFIVPKELLKMRVNTKELSLK